MKVIWAAVFSLFAAPALADCDGDGRCDIAGGTYHIAVPEAVEAPPMVLWLHGFGGSGEGALRNTGMVNRYLERGYAFAAADGLPREGQAEGRTSWAFHPDRPQQRDEAAFFAAILDDAQAQFGIDRDRVILAGFSIGGSMTSYVACQNPDLFDAYAPVAGSFWRPHPTECAGPVRLFHTHGWRDMTVPLEGRPLGGGVIEQGDVWYAMDMWRQTNGCLMHRADEFEDTGDFWRRRWTECEAGALEFALHPGGHGIPQGWSGMMLDWYEGLPQ